MSERMSANSDIRVAYKAKIQAFNKQLHDLVNVLLNSSRSNFQIPAEVAIELQHMLVHLVSAGSMASSDYQSKSVEMGHALGHLDRAFMDECKILVCQRFSDLEGDLEFMRQWVSARQKECKKHFRDQAHETASSTVGAPLEINNYCCNEFLNILTSFKVVQLESTSAVAVRPDHNVEWKDFAKQLKEWFCLDLLYSSLCCQKSYDALNIVTSSLWTLDAERLKRLNIQMKLDILVLNAPQAAHMQWDPSGLKRHASFLKNYAQRSKWEETDLSSEKIWIQHAFYSLLEFYGINADWPQ